MTYSVLLVGYSFFSRCWDLTNSHFESQSCSRCLSLLGMKIISVWTIVKTIKREKSELLFFLSFIASLDSNSGNGIDDDDVKSLEKRRQKRQSLPFTRHSLLTLWTTAATTPSSPPMMLQRCLRIWSGPILRPSRSYRRCAPNKWKQPENTWWQRRTNVAISMLIRNHADTVLRQCCTPLNRFQKQ